MRLHIPTTLTALLFLLAYLVLPARAQLYISDPFNNLLHSQGPDGLLQIYKAGPPITLPPAEADTSTYHELKPLGQLRSLHPDIGIYLLVFGPPGEHPRVHLAVRNTTAGDGLVYVLRVPDDMFDATTKTKGTSGRLFWWTKTSTSKYERERRTVVSVSTTTSNYVWAW